MIFAQYFSRLCKGKHTMSTFIRTFVLLSVFSVIPILCMAFYYSIMAQKFWKSEIYRFNQNAFARYTNQIDSKILAARGSASQIAEDPSVLSFITDPNFYDFQRNTRIMKSLRGIQKADNGIDLAYLYSAHNKLVLTSEQMGFTYEEFYDKDALDAYDNGTYDPMVDRVYLSDSGEERQFITLYENLPKNSIGDIGCLIFNMDKNYLFSAQDNAAMLQMSVFDASGNCIYQQGQAADYLSDPEFRKQLYSSNGTFTYHVGQEDLVIINSFSPITGWIYVGAAPMPIFFHSYQKISVLLMQIAGIALILSFSLSLAIAYRLYLPLRYLVNSISEKNSHTRNRQLEGEYGYIQAAYQVMAKENQTMESVVREMRPAVKNDFFLCLMNGEPFSQEEIAQKLDFINEGFTQKGYGCVVFQLTDYESYIRNYNQDAQSFHRYMLSHTIADLLENKPYPYSFHQVNRSAWALILNMDCEPGEPAETEYWDIVQALKEKLEEFSFLWIGVGQLYACLGDLPYSYQDAVGSLRLQEYNEGAQADAEEEIETVFFQKSKTKEALLQAIRAGSPEEASDLCVSIFDALSEQDFSSGRALMVASSLVNAFLEILIELGVNIKLSSTLGSSEDYYQLLKSSDSLEKLQSNCLEIVETVAFSVQNFNRTHSERIIERMVEYINNHLQDNVSLNDLASLCHLTPSYVSRLFKENLEIGFVEYINTLRISRAKKLLKETKITVEQIGFQVGFNNVRSFMRTFKQYENITPGQYRTNASKIES